MNYTLKNEGKFTTLAFSQEHTKAALQYWTQERMDAAIPAGIVLPDEKCVPCVTDRRGEVLEVKIADTDASPFNAGGRLFFTRDNKDYVGSAEFCADKRIVLTAAHCFYKGGNFSENIIFRRCYDNDTSEQVVAIQNVFVPAEYINTGDYAYDYALGIAEFAASGQILGYQINSDDGTAVSYGYPTNYEGGLRMVYVEGTYTKYKTGIYEMLGNPMGGGCSGGAWVDRLTNAAVSVNSYSYTSRPDDQYGPIFGTEFESLINSALGAIKPIANSVRYFQLHNSAAVAARMQLKWSLGARSGTYEEDGYHDVCAASERTIDMKNTGIPDGATVYLHASVPLGDDDTADERFIYDSISGETASYKLSGTAFKTNLTLLNG